MIVDIISTHLWWPNDINRLRQFVGLHNACYRTSDRSVGRSNAQSVGLGPHRWGVGGRSDGGNVNILPSLVYGITKRGALWVYGLRRRGSLWVDENSPGPDKRGVLYDHP